MHILRQYIELFENIPLAQPDMETPHTHLVFVYGSLKRAFHNHALLDQSRFLGTGRTPPRFDLIDLGSFPAAITGRHSMTGEVFEVDDETMKHLDRLEGNGFHYQRKQIPVVVRGRQVVVWCYMYLHDDGTDPLVKPEGGTVTWRPPSDTDDDDDYEDWEDDASLGASSSAPINSK